MKTPGDSPFLSGDEAASHDWHLTSGNDDGSCERRCRCCGLLVACHGALYVALSPAPRLCVGVVLQAEVPPKRRSKSSSLKAYPLRAACPMADTSAWNCFSKRRAAADAMRPEATPDRLARRGVRDGPAARRLDSKHVRG